MYAMTGKLTALSGLRQELVTILNRAADLVGRMEQCHMYIVCEDVADESAVWVFEMWTDKQAHDNSLKDDSVRALIAQARPLLAGAPDGAELRVAGGHGLRA